MYQVMIVDDEMLERMALGKKLKKHFGDLLQIVQAENGIEAVRTFKKLRPRIVIMDIGMPGMNGVSAAEAIHELDRQAVIIFLTAFDEFSYAKRAISIGALEYLLKPCEERELLPVMEEAMRQADLRQMNEELYVREHPADEGVRADEEVSESGIRDVASVIQEYVRTHYMQEISMQDAARAMNYSDSYFCKLFKQCFDQNFTTYLTDVRIREAKRLLADQGMSVRDVGLNVGYGDSRYFSRVFKRMTGMLPSEYRDRHYAQK